jgi:hypothetical protein
VWPSQACQPVLVGSQYIFFRVHPTPDGDQFVCVVVYGLQKHYDWGLRAIKSVLVVAGSLLRAEAGQVESDVLFRALRDFNIPKILAQVCDTASDTVIVNMEGVLFMRNNSMCCFN